MKLEALKWGIKVFVLADGSNGYVFRFQIYTGKNSSLSNNEVGLCTNVVLELISGLENMHPKLFVDNYYTSPTLFIKLYMKGVNACGTARAGRKFFPADLKITNAESRHYSRGHYDYRSSGPMAAYVWKDKRIIYFMSTMHTSNLPVTINRTLPDGSRGDVECPPPLPDYQQYMRGVDVGDQAMSYYYCGRRSIKWWKRVFFYLLEVSCLNAYILKYYGVTGKKQSFLDFRMALASQLIGEFSSRKRQGRPRSSTPSELRLDDTKKHLPKFVEKKGRCHVCAEKSKRLGSAAWYRHESKY